MAEVIREHSMIAVEQKLLLSELSCDSQSWTMSVAVDPPQSCRVVLSIKRGKHVKVSIQAIT
jgi:hypothetical protein